MSFFHFDHHVRVEWGTASVSFFFCGPIFFSISKLNWNDAFRGLAHQTPFLLLGGSVGGGGGGGGKREYIAWLVARFGYLDFSFTLSTDLLSATTLESFQSS